MNDPFHGINAFAEGPADGLTRLKELISRHIYALGGVAQQYKHTVRNQALQWIDIWPWFQDKENQVVEVWSEFWLYRQDGNLQWHIKIIWGMSRLNPFRCTITIAVSIDDIPTTLLTELDFDGPDQNKQHAHYGYEVYLNEHRMAGPGHVNFTRIQPPYIRDANKMHEVHKGVYKDQVWGNAGYEDMRIDYALRLWSLGKDVEIEQASSSDQEYFARLWAAPMAWSAYDRSSFGQSA